MPFKPFRKEFIIETSPKIEGIKCKALLYGLFFMLTIFPLLVALYVWYEYDWFYAFGAALFLYIISSIVGSKLRLLSVPSDQLERSLSSMEIARWYVGSYLC